MIAQSHRFAICLLRWMSVFILACFLVAPAFAQPLTSSSINFYTDKNVIPEGSTASILIRPDFTITDPITVNLKVTGGKNKVTLSPSCLLYTSDAADE